MNTAHNQARKGLAPLDADAKKYGAAPTRRQSRIEESYRQMLGEPGEAPLVQPCRRTAPNLEQAEAHMPGWDLCFPAGPLAIAFD